MALRARQVLTVRQAQLDLQALPLMLLARLVQLVQQVLVPQVRLAQHQLLLAPRVLTVPLAQRVMSAQQGLQDQMVHKVMLARQALQALRVISVLMAQLVHKVAQVQRVPQALLARPLMLLVLLDQPDLLVLQGQLALHQLLLVPLALPDLQVRQAPRVLLARQVLHQT